MSDIDRIVEVLISRQTTQIARASFGAAMFLSLHTRFAERYRIYTDAADMLTDGFVVGDEAYKAAVKYFSASPKPSQIYIGRIAAGDANIAASIAAVRVENDDWWGLGIADRTKAVIVAAAAVIETLPKVFIACSEDADVLTGATDDVASTLKTAGYDRTAYLWSADQENYPEMRWFGEMLPKDPGSATWKFKQLSGITADYMTTTQRSNAHGKNANTFLTVGGVNITENGCVASGEWIDVMLGIDYVTARMQENIYSELVNLDKIPFTNGGIAIVENLERQVLEDAVAKSIFSSYTIESPDISEISTGDKLARILPDMKWEGILAGAVHKVKVSGTVTV